MTLEEAIKTAIEYETVIRDIYRKGAGLVTDPAGRRALKRLEEEERHHIDYLNDRLVSRQKTGKWSFPRPASHIPAMETVVKEAENIESFFPPESMGTEMEILGNALKAEIETSRFYERMTDEMSGEGRRMFAEFLKIENHHVDVVRHQLDYVMKTGYWLGFKEYDMEGY